MKILSFTLVVLTVASTAVFAQTKTPVQRIVLTLKKTTPSATCPEPCEEQFFIGPRTGIRSIDSIHQKFHAIAVEKQYTGKALEGAMYVVQFPEGTNTEKLMNAYQQTDVVKHASLDVQGHLHGMKTTSPDDAYYGRQWGLKNYGTFTESLSIAGADIDMENAWDITTGSSNVIVAVLDGGAKLNHPEFNGRIWTNTQEIAGNDIDEDGNGLVDDYYGWDFAGSDNDPSDIQGHGTNVAGIIGANANAIGYTGVDWNCKLMILRVINDEDVGFYSWWASAIYYAIEHGAKVINMSLGGTTASTVLEDAINYALEQQVTVVVSIGNSNNTVYYPAKYPGVIAVGATNPNDKRSRPFFWSTTSGSGYGNHISVVAPGNYIYGLYHGSDTEFGYYWGGTSQAAPHVSGLASLLLAQDDTRTPAQIKSIIESTAEDRVGRSSEDTPGWDKYHGYGRVNAYHALSGLTTSIEESNSEKEQVSIFPNPTSQEVHITFPITTTDIQITNALGQPVLSQHVDGIEKINIQLYENGIYFVVVKTNKKTLTQKLVVQK